MQVKQIVKELGIKVSRENTYSHELYCWCPFHDEDSPSFNINYITGKWQCHAASCAVKGRSVDDLSQKLVGKVFNVEEESNWADRIHEQLYPSIKREAQPFIPLLPLALKNEGQTFLNKRGIENTSINKWNLMYWKSVNAIVIPIEFYGYILRYIDATKTKEKYKYVSGTKITNSLFGEENLTFGEEKSIILVEGSLDAISMHQKGFKNTLALLHADMSDMQMRILMKYMYPVYLMLDPDIAGVMASMKIYKKLRSNFVVRTCLLPDGKDPDSCSIEEIKKALDGAKLGGVS
jgi:DNA primase